MWLRRGLGRVGRPKQQFRFQNKGGREGSDRRRGIVGSVGQRDTARRAFPSQRLSDWIRMKASSTQMIGYFSYPRHLQGLACWFSLFFLKNKVNIRFDFQYLTCMYSKHVHAKKVFIKLGYLHHLDLQLVERLLQESSCCLFCTDN